MIKLLRGLDQVVDVDLMDDLGTPIDFEDCQEVTVDLMVNKKPVFNATKTGDSIKPKAGFSNQCFFIVSKDDTSTWSTGFCEMKIAIKRYRSDLGQDLTTGDINFLFEVI